MLLPAALVVAAILWRRRWALDLIAAALAGAAAVIFVKIASAAVPEQRPFIVEHVHPLLAHAADNAFPSDHLTACGVAFAYLWPRSRPMAILALLASAAIAAARVLAVLHWPGDVAAGFFIGVLAAVCGQALAAFLLRSKSAATSGASTPPAKSSHRRE